MAGAKYTLNVEARLNKDRKLDQQLQAKISELRKSGATDVVIRTKWDKDGLAKFSASTKDALGNVTREVSKYQKGSTKALESVTHLTDKATKSTNYFTKAMIQSAKSAATYALSIGLIYKALAQLGDGVQFVKDLDKSLTDAQIVTGYTDDEISKLATSYNSLAKELKVTTLEVAEGSLEFLRQGKTIEETNELVRSSAIMAKLGNLDAAQSTEYLTSIMNGYKMEVSELPGIIDKIIQLDNTFATSTDEVASALQRSAVSGSQAGVSLEELSSMVAVISQVTRREGQVIGTALRTIFTRFQDIAKGNLDEEGMGINNVDDALQRVGISIRDDAGQFRDFTDVLEELFPVWQKLDTIERANIAKALAGTRQRESLLVLLENETLYRKGLTEQMGVDGLAVQRYETYLDSLAAAQASSTAAWEEMMSATIDGNLVKWFYDASAGLFEFISNLGGLDTLLAGVSAALLTYGAGMISAQIATGGLTIAWEALTVAIASNPLGILAVAIGAVTIAAIGLNNEINELHETSSEKWKDSMQKIAESTNDSDAVIEKFIKDVEYLNNLSPKESFFVNEQKLIKQGLEDTLDILEKTSSGWREYSDSTKKAAEAAGYLIDADGRLYKEANYGSGIVKEYSETLDTLSYSEMTAGHEAEQLSEQIERVGKSASTSSDEVLAFTESFNQFLEASYAGMEGSSEPLDNLFGQLSNINRQFQEGTVDVETYFEQLEDSLEDVDMTSMFGEDNESAELFFSGIASNAAEALDMINTSFEDGEISITNYTEQLAELGDVFEQIGAISEHFDLGDAVKDSLSDVIAGVDELRQAQETNIIVQETMRQVVEEGLQFESQAYATQIDLASQAMAQSGIIYKNHQGQILQGSEQLRNFMMQDAGNFQHLADQTANATGRSIQKVVQAAGKMLVTLGNAISSFDATISFTPNIKGDVALPGLAGMVGMSLPIVDYNIKASTSGMSDIGAAIAGFGESLSTAEFNLDASIYTQGFDTAKEEFDAVGDSVGSLTNAFNNLAKNSKATAKQIKEDAKSIDDLVDMVVKKIKQEQKARKDALKDQLKDYKKIIDKRKELLRTMKEEEDYQRTLKDNQRDLGNIQSEMAELRLDDSEEAQARLRALEEEAALLQEQIDEDASDRGIELQEDALDEAYDVMKDSIESQIELIDKYLSEPGQIVSDALDMINEKGGDLYSDLINWNSVYGTGIKNDVVSAWDEAYEAMLRYEGGLAGITGNTFGAVPMSKPDMASSYDAAMPSPMSNFPTTSMPVGEESDSGLVIEKFMELNVAGNLDASTLPQIESIVDRTIEKLNESMRSRGYGKRQASQYSI